MSFSASGGNCPSPLPVTYCSFPSQLSLQRLISKVTWLILDGMVGAVISLEGCALWQGGRLGAHFSLEHVQNHSHGAFHHCPQFSCALHSTTETLRKLWNVAEVKACWFLHVNSKTNSCSCILSHSPVSISQHRLTKHSPASISPYCFNIVM